MSTIIAETTDTAVELSLTANDQGGAATGLTIVASVYDAAAATNKWLNMTSGVWQPTVNTKVMPEIGTSGHYLTTADVSNAANAHLRAYYEITAGAVGIAEDVLILSSTLDGANATDQATILADVATIEASTTANLDVAVSSRAVAGDEMALTAQALIDVVNAVWDEANSSHLVAGSTGYNQDQAAAGGAGVTPIQIENAVWGAFQVDHTDSGTMGKAVADSATLPSQLLAALNRYFQIVRKYGPIAAKQPIATRDEVHVDDLGIILTIPVILDGNYSDLADATSIMFAITAPGGTEHAKSGLGLTTLTGSYTTWTSDADVFDTTGRWRVQVTVTWPDLTTKQSNIFNIDVQSPMPSL